MRLVLASRNPHKVRELAGLLAPHEVRPLPEEVTLPPEEGETFAANAAVKARIAAQATGALSIADDSGIEAAALGGAPGVRSARFAGEGASDEENLAKLLRDAPAGSALAYVCALAVVDPESGEERIFEGRCTGRLADRPRGTGGFGYDPAFLPDDLDDGRTMAELSAAEKDAISHRGRAAALLGSWLTGAGGTEGARTRARPKARAAAVSIASNTVLIVLKLVAGLVTGSVAILTEAVHSGIDLIASFVAYFSVRAADEPADESHRYGHEKIENLAAAIEGMLILVGSAVIVYEAARRLASSAEVERLGFGIGVVAFSMVANVAVSAYLRSRAREHESAALAGDAAHLSTDAATSAAVLVGLTLVQITGERWIDPAVALAVAGVILVTGARLLTLSSRVLVDEALPEPELEAIRDAVDSFGERGVVGYHQLRTRRAGARRYVDLHLQFESGTSLESAHATAHELQDAIEDRLGKSTDVLIHLEPADRVRPDSATRAGR